MDVNLIDFTGKGTPDPASYAAGLLIFTKNTRLEMDAAGLDRAMALSPEGKARELEYMANTIPSSWEFVHYTFAITGVTRAFTHQLVRTRTASFAQQTMRVLNVDGWTYGTGPSIPSESEWRNFETFGDGRDHLARNYHDVMDSIAKSYQALIEAGAKIEDARGILPTNIHTNIIMSVNMRTLVEMVRKRSSPRTQGEYREVLDGLVTAVREVHPWIDLFVNRTFERAAKDLDARIAALDLPEAEKAGMIKLVDQMRGQS